MSDFCSECSLRDFGEDFGDMAGIARPGELVAVLCEGCGATIMVDENGVRHDEE